MEGHRYFIDREAYLVNVRFTLHETLAIHLATRLLATRMNRQKPHAAAALRKLGLAIEWLAPRISTHMQESADEMDDDDRHQDPAYLVALERVTIAWAELRKVRIWYQPDSSKNLKEYIFCPYFVEPYAVGQTTYMIGYCEPQHALRTFKIERIQRIEKLEEPYEIPDDFKPSLLMEDAWGIWYTESEPVKVVLKFGPQVARRVGETRWHRSEQVTILNDGSLLWCAWIDEPKEMMPWIRGWGADCEVLEPPELRDELVSEMHALRELYT